MYWAVVGAFVAFEYVSGWLLDWSVALSAHHAPHAHIHVPLLSLTRVPFYWEARTVFLLFLALPQTQVRFPVYLMLPQ